MKTQVNGTTGAYLGHLLKGFEKERKKGPVERIKLLLKDKTFKQMSNEEQQVMLQALANPDGWFVEPPEVYQVYIRLPGNGEGAGSIPAIQAPLPLQSEFGYSGMPLDNTIRFRYLVAKPKWPGVVVAHMITVWCPTNNPADLGFETWLTVEEIRNMGLMNQDVTTVQVDPELVRHEFSKGKED